MAGPPNLPLTDEDVARLAGQTERLFAFGQAAALPSGGFGWLDADGRPDPSRPRHLWVNARMTYVFALAQLMGWPGADALVVHGLSALSGPFHDDQYGGWFATYGEDGPVGTDKTAYEHAFVLLAASAATVAGRPGAEALLDEALTVVDRYFWVEEEGAACESWDREWRTSEPYRGANANMHLTEALLAAADATGDTGLRDRALRIVRLVVLDKARAHGWRVPEHYDPQWNELLDYHRDEPRHPFRPYGVTPGHGMEWARLLLHLDAARGVDELLPAARSLFATAVADGWDTAAGGFVYTTDFDGQAVVADRFHWVVAEAMAASWALARVTGDASYGEWFHRVWTFADEHLVDHASGGWQHELDSANRPADRTWRGRPDIYHAVQATLLPRLPLHPMFARALAESSGRAVRSAQGRFLTLQADDVTPSGDGG